MANFLIASDGDDARMSDLVSTNFGSDSYKISENQWLVSHKGTTKDVYKDLFPTDANEFGRFIIAKIDSYYGLHSPDIWEWLEAKSD